MKRSGILNKDLCDVIASIGHLDTLCVCDAGLPIPEDRRRVDLALVRNIPRFFTVIDELLKEFIVEKMIIANETQENSPQVIEELKKRLPNVPIEFVPHTEFKQRTRSVKGVVRSGEYTSFCNVIFVSGVDHSLWN
ncbi:MAG TPA: D-ribose pyranase [Bacillota bacterium]|jgi:D-ribose pyranase|nr:D-ribose pyranase [Bacillota bacterium]